MPTRIEWCHETWNPITGCSPISEGCKNCYAQRMARRLAGRYGYPETPNHFDVTFHPDRLNQPLKWKKPKKIFVCSMGDLFHEDVKESWVHDVWTAMGEFYDQNGEIQPASNRPGHIYLILTKRPQRALDFLNRRYPGGYARNNVWIGVTAENQKQADERIPILLQIPAAIRFVSVEPMLEPVNIKKYLPFDTKMEIFLRGYNPTISGCEGVGILNKRKIKLLRCVIAGPETGPRKRECKPEWIRNLYEQCQRTGVPFFDKTKKNWIAREFPNG